VDNLDGMTLPGSWKQAPRGWGNNLHKLAPYLGGYPPALAHYFVSRYSDPGATVYDPFSGGGTTVLEALLMGREGIGNDAFPYAYVLSSAKSCPMTPTAFSTYLKAKLREAESQPGDLALLDNEDMLVFFHEKTLDELLRLRTVVKDDPSPEALFLKAVICGVLHGPSKMFLSLSMKDTTSSTTNYVRNYVATHGLIRPERGVYASAMNKMARSTDGGLPDHHGTIHYGDARATPIRDESVDVIVTSPPYMSVLDYPWNNWIRLWWLGEDRLASRAKLTSTSVEKNYRRFMCDVCRELYRVLKPNSAAVIVVGDVKKVRPSGEVQFINSALLIAEEAARAGFEIECIINDTYKMRNRPFLVFNALKWEYDPSEHAAKSSVPIDRCLVLRKGIVRARDVDAPWLRTPTGQYAFDIPLTMAADN